MSYKALALSVFLQVPFYTEMCVCVCERERERERERETFR